MYTFDEIVGQDQIKKSLINAYLADKISHAYIFFGMPSSGKGLITNAFAKMLLCQDDKKKPCCKCVSCITFDSFNNPDIIRVIPGKNKSIGVDDIREQVIKNIEIKPYKYRYKIFIIDNADTMTVQAQNSLLRTIEDPPNYGVFLLISNNNNNFLNTILSRCVQLKLSPLTSREIANYLIINKKVSSEQAEIFASFAQGSLGRAIAILSSDFSKLREHTLGWLTKLDSMTIFNLLRIPVEIENLGYKDYSNDILDIVILWYRDILVFKETADVNYLVQKDIIGLIINAADKLSFDDLYLRIDVVFEAKRNIEVNANWLLLMEDMLLKILKET